MESQFKHSPVHCIHLNCSYGDASISFRSRKQSYAQVPDALTSRAQWVCWREEALDGKPTKVPIDAETGSYASTRDADTWAAFSAVLEGVDRVDADGIGFVFTEDDPFAGVDLDGCRYPETGRTEVWAQDIIERLDSYTEVSPSETGYHVLVQGDFPGDRCRNGPVEMYDSGRFFTVTGDHVPGTPSTVYDRSAALAEVYRDYLQEDDEPSREDPVSSRSSSRPADGDYADEKVIEMACEAANGDTFERLWTGDISGYDSHSEADMALCCYLAFWTGGDAASMDQLFRQSGLMRDKWDTVHYADGSTYGEKTVQRAIGLTDEFYGE